MENFDTLLTNINRNNIHLPPEIDEVLNFFNSKKPIHDRNRCHAYKIFRYSVVKECKRIREFNFILIGRATNHLWKIPQHKKSRATNHLWKIPQHKKSQNTLI
ncbi:hypothetical protein Glove_151g93 [Diversispora epigaea]|uniref:Uncharacterized protein n=1 Tax=Diversispora epigaea TaxID=1348612 RepID=A0A397IVX8_9GLOM|nr:hypothetical protein Glove_151g93 [Diversispora epigaea]